MDTDYCSTNRFSFVFISKSESSRNSLISVCNLHRACVGSELPNTFLLCKHPKNNTNLSWLELKVSRGWRDRATDSSNLLRDAVRAREASRVDYPVACIQKNCGGCGKKTPHLCPSVGFQSIQCQRRQGIRQDTCMCVRGGRRVFFFFCASACLFEKGRGLCSLWTPTEKQLYRNTFILNSTDIKSSTRTLHCLTPHTLQHCTPTRDKAQALKFHAKTSLENVFVV